MAVAYRRFAFEPLALGAEEPLSYGSSFSESELRSKTTKCSTEFVPSLTQSTLILLSSLQRPPHDVIAPIT